MSHDPLHPAAQAAHASPNPGKETVPPPVSKELLGAVSIVKGLLALGLSKEDLLHAVELAVSPTTPDETVASAAHPKKSAAEGSAALEAAKDALNTISTKYPGTPAGKQAKTCLVHIINAKLDDEKALALVKQACQDLARAYAGTPIGVLSETALKEIAK